MFAMKPINVQDSYLHYLITKEIPVHGILNMAQAVLDSPEGSDKEANRERLALLISVGKRMSFECSYQLICGSAALST